MFFSNSALKGRGGFTVSAHRLEIDWIRVILCGALWVQYFCFCGSIS